MPHKKILIIEDDISLSETISMALRAKGYEIFEYSDSDGALDIASDFLPDLILMDYLLPSWNGGELCSTIRAVDILKNVPLIIMSAYARLLFSIGDYGCDAVLQKPFELQKLETVINKLINRSEKKLP